MNPADDSLTTIMETSDTVERDLELCAEGFEPYAVLPTPEGRGYLTFFRRYGLASEATVSGTLDVAAPVRDCGSCGYLVPFGDTNQCTYHGSTRSDLSGCSDWTAPEDVPAVPTGGVS